MFHVLKTILKNVKKIIHPGMHQSVFLQLGRHTDILAVSVYVILSTNVGTGTRDDQ